MKKKIPFFALATIIFLLSYRFFLLKFAGIGHNWDWTFPALDFLSSRMFILSSYTWYNFDLGGQLDLTISHLIPNYMFSWLSSVMHVKEAIFLLFLLIELISFCSFKELLDYLLKKRGDINYIPALLFSFSPFLFNEIISGSWYMWISYAFTPLFFLSLARYIEDKQIKHLLAFLFSSIFVFSSLQNFILMEIIFILYFIFGIFLKKRFFEKAKPFLSRYCLAHIVFLFFNGYWIAPFLSLQHNFQKMVLSYEFAGNFSSIKSTEQSIINIFSLVGYLDRNLYYHVISVLPVFLTAIFFILIFIVYAIFFRQNGEIKTKGIIWFSIIALLTLIIKGGQPPFSLVTVKFFEVFPLMKLYRSPQHLMLGAAFIIPILVAFLFNYFFEKSNRKSTTLLFFTLAILIWISGWWMTGDMGNKKLKDQKRNSVDFYSLSPELTRIYTRNEISQLDHRIIFLPTAFSPYYLKNEYQGDGQGGQPEYMYLKNPTLRMETNIFAKNIENDFCFKDEFDLINYLSLINVKHISSRLDILPKFSKCGKLNLWNNKETAKKLNNDPDLKLISMDKYTFSYNINNEKYLPHFYTPAYIIGSTQEADNLPKIISRKNYNIRSAVFFREQNIDKINKLKNLSIGKTENISLPTLEFKKINPTKYHVRIHNASRIFPLVFSESFHDGWQIYLNQNANLIRRDEQNDNLKLKINNYKILDGNSEDQASIDELQDYINSGFVTTLGDLREKTIEHKNWIDPAKSDGHGASSKEKLDYVEKYNIDFISKNFQGTIQNDNLPDGNIWETWFQKPIENNDNHLIANGYANSWVIDTEKICVVDSRSPIRVEDRLRGNDNNSCVKNPDGTYDFEIIVEFWPQRLFYLGLFISGMTLFGCIVFLGYDWKKRRKILDAK